MDFRRLTYFIAVAERLSFSKAAEELHVAQPAISQQIRALESELGVQLFDRVGKRVSLTDAGRAELKLNQEGVERIWKRAGGWKEWGGHMGPESAEIWNE